MGLNTFESCSNTSCPYFIINPEKHIKLDLTNNLKGKGLEINFLIEEKDGKITTIPKQLYLHGFYIRRMLRKGTDYVEDSFLTQCKDNRLRIKPFLITRKRVSNQVLRGLREKAKEEINQYVQDKGMDLIVPVVSCYLKKTLLFGETGEKYII